MKDTRFNITSILIGILFQFTVTLPALASPQLLVENYDKGELELFVTPFGEGGNEIKIGKIDADGAIHFNWPDIDTSKIESIEFFMGAIERVSGMTFCHDKQIELNDKTVKIVDTKTIYLYKYGRPVGTLFPATQKELENNEGFNRHSGLILGSTISWFYSNGSAGFKAKCMVNQESKNSYDFKEVTTYDIQLNPGWNIVEHELLAKEDWKNATGQGSLPKTISKMSVAKIPNTIKWYMNYTANDELLELEHKLVTQTPMSAQQFDDWVPKKLGDLTRTDYTVGAKLEHLPGSNNINVTFSGNGKKINIIIVDSAGDKETASAFTLVMSMMSRAWKDESKTGYDTSTKMDGTPVLIEFKEEGKHTTLSYNANQRLMVRAVAENMEPEELWQYLQQLQLDQLN